VLSSLGGESPLDGTRITLEFEEGWLGGFAGCNRYGGGPDSGDYAAREEDGSLAIPMLAITAMACPAPEGVMEQEQAYIEALQQAVTFQLEGERLELQDSGGGTILAFVRAEAFQGDPSALVGTVWRLTSLNGRAPGEASAPTLYFQDEQRLSGHTGCRGYVALYEADGGDLRVSFLAMLGPVCPEGALQDQDDAYIALLGESAHYRPGEGELEILTIRDEALAFEPLPRETGAPMEGSTWSLLAFVDPSSAEGRPAPLPLPVDLLAGSEITLALEDGTARGSAGCNTYQAAYGLETTSIAFQGLTYTERACLTPEGVMAQEGRYLDLLGDVVAHHAFGRQLWLEADDGRALVFSAKP
jgi:heat shock protein HslJ